MGVIISAQQSIQDVPVVLGRGTIVQVLKAPEVMST